MAALTYTGQRKAFVRPNRTYDYLYGELKGEEWFFYCLLLAVFAR